MQEKNTKAVRGQIKKRQRMERIRNTVLRILFGWGLLAIILIIVLLVLLFQTRTKLEAAIKKENQLIEELEQLKQAKMTEGTTAAEGWSIYLTFEDGPSDNTVALLDVLKEKGIKASFFVTGKEDEASREAYTRIVKEGHTLGMHSYSNKYHALYASEESFQQDLCRLREYLKEITGVTPVYYRFPGGSSNQVTNVPMKNLIHYLNQEGIVYYDWNVSAGNISAGEYSAEEIAEKVSKEAENYQTAVVLLHDEKENGITAEALEKLIDTLLAREAELLPITEKTSVIQFVKADEIG